MTVHPDRTAGLAAVAAMVARWIAREAPWIWAAIVVANLVGWPLLWMGLPVGVATGAAFASGAALAFGRERLELRRLGSHCDCCGHRYGGDHIPGRVCPCFEREGQA